MLRVYALITLAGLTASFEFPLPVERGCHHVSPRKNATPPDEYLNRRSLNEFDLVEPHLLPRSRRQEILHRSRLPTRPRGPLGRRRGETNARDRRCDQARASWRIKRNSSKPRGARGGGRRRNASEEKFVDEDGARKTSDNSRSSSNREKNETRRKRPDTRQNEGEEEPIGKSEGSASEIKTSQKTKPRRTEGRRSSSKSDSNDGASRSDRTVRQRGRSAGRRRNDESSLSEKRVTTEKGGGREGKDVNSRKRSSQKKRNGWGESGERNFSKRQGGGPRSKPGGNTKNRVRDSSFQKETKDRDESSEKKRRDRKRTRDSSPGNGRVVEGIFSDVNQIDRSSRAESTAQSGFLVNRHAVDDFAAGGSFVESSAHVDHRGNIALTDVIGGLAISHS